MAAWKMYCEGVWFSDLLSFSSAWTDFRHSPLSESSRTVVFQTPENPSNAVCIAISRLKSSQRPQEPLTGRLSMTSKSLGCPLLKRLHVSTQITNASHYWRCRISCVSFTINNFEHSEIETKRFGFGKFTKLMATKCSVAPIEWYLLGWGEG